MRARVTTSTDLSVHDNLIHGDVCDGINFATVDPSKGPVRAFNNIIYDVGRGPDPPDDASSYSCIYVPGITNAGADGSGTIEIFNNTFYNCGGRNLLPGIEPIDGVGAISREPYSPALYIRLANNIMYSAGEAYIAPGSATSLIQGSHNLWFGDGAAPAFLTENMSADPLFADLASGDFRVNSESPVIDAGIDTGTDHDYAGVSRPQGRGYDIGAMEFTPHGSSLNMDSLAPLSMLAFKQNSSQVPGRRRINE